MHIDDISYMSNLHSTLKLPHSPVQIVLMDVQFLRVLLDALHERPERGFQMGVLGLIVGIETGVEGAPGGVEVGPEGGAAGGRAGGRRGRGRGGRRGRDAATASWPVVGGGVHREVWTGCSCSIAVSRRVGGRHADAHGKVGRPQRGGVAGGELDFGVPSSSMVVVAAAVVVIAIAGQAARADGGDRRPAAAAGRIVETTASIVHGRQYRGGTFRGQPPGRTVRHRRGQICRRIGIGRRRIVGGSGMSGGGEQAAGPDGRGSRLARRCQGQRWRISADTCGSGRGSLVHLDVQGGTTGGDDIRRFLHDVYYAWQCGVSKCRQRYVVQG